MSNNKTNSHRLSNKPSHWIVLIGLSLACFLGCLDFTIVSTGLPAIQHSLNTSISQLQWVISGFMLVLSASMVLAVGIALDKIGAKKIMLLGFLLFSLFTFMQTTFDTHAPLIYIALSSMFLLISISAGVLLIIYLGLKQNKIKKQKKSTPNLGLNLNSELAHLSTDCNNHWWQY